MRLRKSTDMIIQEFKEKHGDTYDYSNVEYTGSCKPVRIICPIHGEFSDRPNRFLNNDIPCFRCRQDVSKIKRRELFLNEFVVSSNHFHNNTYDYSKVEYINHKIKVCIICPIHGEFYQTPNSHRQSGCKKCADDSNRLDSNMFITKAINKHGNKYDYSKVEYIDSRTKVCIICSEHGEFWQQPGNHLHGNGCVKCSGRFMYNLNDFIEIAINKHGDKYDYSKVEYIGSTRKVYIICQEHGGFWQTPADHIYNRSGCPKCVESKGEAYISKLLSKSNVTYIKQHMFNNCRDIRPLKFDFYIPDVNTCIEYDGRQHFEPVSVFGGVDAFNDTQRRDGIKNKFCILEGINLIRIRFDDDIDKILTEKLLIF